MGFNKYSNVRKNIYTTVDSVWFSASTGCVCVSDFVFHYVYESVDNDLSKNLKKFISEKKNTYG